MENWCSKYQGHITSFKKLGPFREIALSVLRPINWNHGAVAVSGKACVSLIAYCAQSNEDSGQGLNPWSSGLQPEHDKGWSSRCRDRLLRPNSAEPTPGWANGPLQALAEPLAQLHHADTMSDSLSCHHHKEIAPGVGLAPLCGLWPKKRASGEEDAWTSPYSHNRA
jgi:hypothetical protein